MTREDEEVLLALSTSAETAVPSHWGCWKTVSLGMTRSLSAIDSSIWRKLSGSGRCGQRDSS